MRKSCFRAIGKLRTPEESKHGRHFNLLFPQGSFSTSPDSTRYVRSLQTCGDATSLEKLHSLLIVDVGLTETKHEGFVGELIRKYLQFGRPESAIWTYHTVKEPTLALMNMTIRCLSYNDLHDELLSFYASLQKTTTSTFSCHRCGSDNFTFPFVIKACAAVSAPLLGKEAHCRVLRSGFGSNAVVQTALVDMYAKCGCVEDFRKVFDGITHRDLVSWNAFLYGFSSNGLDREAFGTFREILFCGLRPNASTFVSIIPVCARIGAFNAGRSLHGLALKLGTLNTQSLIPTLISMYACFEDLSAAKVLFEKTSDRVDVAWNAIISAYARNGQFEEAFKIFRKMYQESMKPTQITFVSILSCCGNLLSPQGGESLHASCIKHGFINKVSVITSLLSMYAKLGVTNTAQFLFDSIPHKNLLSWNSMISGFILNEQFFAALDTFHEMQQASMMPDFISIISILSACSKLNDLQLGRSVHAFILKNRFESNPNVINGLMAMYISCDKLSSCMQLFNNMPEKNLSSWNTLISGSVQIGSPSMSISLFNQMETENISFDIVTMICILPVFNRVEDLLVGMSFHSHAINVGYCSDVSLVNVLINMYMNCDDIEAGYLLFNSMICKDVVSWNVLMSGLRNHKIDKEVAILFNKMISHGERPNAITLLNILSICTNQMLGKSIHGYAVRNFDFLEDSLLTSIMSMYSKFENVNSCLLLFEFANKRNIIVWNTMMSMYTQSKHMERAITNFREMLKLKIEPDHVTILSLISACSQLGSLELATNVTGYVVKKGFLWATCICNSMIDMHAKCGSILLARDVFNFASEKDSITWSAMINGYGLHGNGEAALSLFFEMKEAGVELDDVVFLVVLSACSHAALVEEGRNIFRTMREEHHVVPRGEHFSCMVDLFSRTGHLEEAYDIIKKNPSKTTSGMLESLLGACSFHGNIKLGEEISRLLNQSDPSSSRSFVLLSNIYAAAGMWTDSFDVRSDMEMRGLIKDPGYSFISVK